MSTRDLLTVGQAATIRKDGGAEFITHNASIQPDPYTSAIDRLIHNQQF
jgi:hypothetical protein